MCGAQRVTRMSDDVVGVFQREPFAAFPLRVQHLPQALAVNVLGGEVGQRSVFAKFDDASDILVRKGASQLDLRVKLVHGHFTACDFAPREFAP